MLALLPIAAAAMATSTPYPADEVFAEVRGLCAALTTLDATTSNAKARGWEASPTGKNSPLAKRVAFLVGASKAGGAKIRSTLWSKVVAGESLHAFLYEERTRKDVGVGCQIYDIDEDRPISRAEIEKYVGKAADWLGSLGTGNLMLTWRRNAPLGNSKFEYAFFPADGSEVILSGLAGIRITTVAQVSNRNSDISRQLEAR